MLTFCQFPQLLPEQRKDHSRPRTFQKFLRPVAQADYCHGWLQRNLETVNLSKDLLY